MFLGTHAIIYPRRQARPFSAKVECVRLLCGLIPRLNFGSKIRQGTYVKCARITYDLCSVWLNFHTYLENQKIALQPTLYKLWPWLQYAEEKDVVISQFEAEVQ